MMKSVKRKLLRLQTVLACLFLLVLFFPVPLWAADAAPQTALQNLTDQIFAVLTPVLVAVIGTLAAWILVKLKNKLHLSVAQSTMDSWSTLAQNAAMRGAEWARQKTKSLEDGKKIPGGDVMDVAVNWALQMAEHQGLPALAREKLVGLIEAELMKLRVSGAEPPTAPAAPATPTTPPAA